MSTISDVRTIGVNVSDQDPALADVDELLRWGDVPPMFPFDDPVGDRRSIVEETA